MPSLEQWIQLGREYNLRASKLKITKVSGYVDTPIAKKCGTCEYLSHDRTQCDNKVVAKDTEVKTGKNGLKNVSAENGCCNEWEPK